MHRRTLRGAPRPSIARRARFAAGGLALALLAGIGAGAAPATAGASPSVRSLVQAARKAILSHHSVRIVSTGKDRSSRKRTGTWVIDAGLHASKQRGVAGAARVGIRLTPSYAYFSGNRDGLTTVFSMPADDLGRVGTKWVAIKRSEAQYKGFSSSVITSLPGQILPTASETKHVRLRTTRHGGQQLYVLTWSTTVGSQKVPVTLELPAAGATLPVSETKVLGSTVERSVFSHWDERLVVRPPAHTVAFSSLSST